VDGKGGRQVFAATMMMVAKSKKKGVDRKERILDEINIFGVVRKILAGGGLVLTLTK
jgi:hypothetical protein